MQNASAPRRHPEQGGYARGGETRARIVATALRIFGARGYDQASTRQIAAEAGVNPPALQYYFHSKEGLHRACAQHIIDRMADVVLPALERAAQAVAKRNRMEATETLFGLLDALAEGLAAAGAESWSRFIARGRADGAGPAVALIRERITLPLHETVAQLLGVITGREPHDDIVLLRAFAILGQVNWFHAFRDNTLSVMGWSDFDPDNLNLIKNMVREHTQAILSTVADAAPTSPRGTVTSPGPALDRR